jgi:hypothetical protein
VLRYGLTVAAEVVGVLLFSMRRRGNRQR